MLKIEVGIQYTVYVYGNAPCGELNFDNLCCVQCCHLPQPLTLLGLANVANALIVIITLHQQKIPKTLALMTSMWVNLELFAE